MDDPGRSRGRARGRSRPPQQEGDAGRAAAQQVQRGGMNGNGGGNGAGTNGRPQRGAPGGAGEPIPSRGITRGGVAPSGTAGITRAMGGLTVSGERPVLLGSRRMFDASLFDPATRPAGLQTKKGVSGNPVPLICNFFQIIVKQNWTLHQYRVDFNPEVDHKGARRGMLRDHKEMLGNFMFDGTMLFTTRFLPKNPQPKTDEDKKVEVFSKRRTDGANIRITISHTANLPPDSPVSLQVYNIVFRRVLELLGMKQVGRNYYNPSMGFTVDCGRVNFELWPGFVTSILQYENKLLLCAEISHKLMRKESVLSILKQLYNNAHNKQDFRERASKALIGLIVLTRYNNSTYRVDEIEFDLNVSNTFERRGEAITYVQYYKEQYNIDIQDRNQPLLLSRPRKKEIRRGGLEVIHLVPELCTVTGLTDEQRADYNVMKALGNHTKQGPQQRAEALQTFAKRMTSKPDIKEEFQKWGLTLDDNLLTLDRETSARQLKPEDIYFEGKDMARGNDKASWDYDLRKVHLLSCVDLKSWVVIHTNRDSRTASEFVQSLGRVSRGLGMKIASPTMAAIQSDRTDQYQNIIKELFAKQRDIQLVCCILPSNRKDRYDAIKKLCCVERPIPSQVVLGKTLSNQKRLMSVATKIAIQMNCKLGGEAWRVGIPLKQTMIVGIDTYHDSSQKGRSVAGFVASLNPSFTRWYSNCTFQHTGGELSDSLKGVMVGALKMYFKIHNILPVRIIIYRDGVGDGQLEMVQQHEIPQLLDACKIDRFPDWTPLVAFVVVKKRINARFFRPAGQGLNNPSPGTIVDDAVTRPDWYDFYVVSQSVREGTVSPTHYNIIYDTTGLKPDHMQQLAYKLCHLYFNWPGTIRVPAPCMYAHKLAFLVGQSIHQQVHGSLGDKLYFL